MTVTAIPQGDNAETEEKPKKRRGRMVVILVLVVAIVGGAAWFLFLKPKHASAPKPGTVLALTEQTVNLAGGHYLKVQISLQLTTTASADVDGSKAENDVINLYSGRDISQLDTSKARIALQKQLKRTLIEDYEGQVMDVYLTEFVTT